MTALFALCSGIGGSGRQSATRLATFMADYDLFQIEITRNYTKSEWREDVKKVTVMACQGYFAFVFEELSQCNAGLKITAGHRTMSGQDDYLSGQNLGLAVILSGHVQGFQMIN